MSNIKKNFCDLGWNVLCEGDCQPGYSHSHDFTLARDLNKICSDCGRKIKPEMQVYATDQENRAKLFNIYNCDCGHNAVTILYDSVPRAYKDVYAAALLNINTLT